MLVLHLDRVRQLEVSLSKPGSTAHGRSSDCYYSRCRILGYICKLAATKEIHSFDRFITARETDVCVRTHWRALISSLEQPKRGCHMLPRQLVIHIAFESARTVGGQGPIIQLAVGAEVVERLVEGTGRI